jgi:NADH-quinone oxidoreductase subunit C
MNDSLRRELDSIFKGIETDVSDGRLTVRATAESALSVLKFLKDAGCDYLQLISCVDWVESGEFEVVYVLSAYLREGGEPGGDMTRVVLKTRVPRQVPSLPTSIHVFPVAEPYEREIHELYGVRFEGHPRLTPLFLEREYEIPPFRKDFDTVQYVEDVFGSVPPVGEES